MRHLDSEGNEMIYNVSAMITRDDNDGCFSFETKAEANKCADDLRKQGAFSVKGWNS